jgi:predicted nucleic acid-binding protein
LIVVDTTVWIDFLESRETDFDVHLKELIEREEPLALTDIIYCEILQGIADDGKFRRTREILLTYPIFKTRGLRTFEHAAQIYRDCRKQGLTIRKTVDCIIAATCIEAGVQLYHNDRDFATIAKVKRLKIYHAT